MEIEVVSPIEAEAEVQRYTLVSDDIFVRRYDASTVPDWYRSLVENIVTTDPTITDIHGAIDFLTLQDTGFHQSVLNLESVDSSINANLVTLTSQVGDNTAGVGSLQVTKVDSTQATAIATDVVASSFGTGGIANAWFTSQISTYASDINANAMNISTLSATLDGHTVSIDTIEEISLFKNATIRSAIAPTLASHPLLVIGDLWVNTADNVVKSWNGTVWVDTTNTATNTAYTWSANASKLITSPDGSVTGWSFGDGTNVQSYFKINATNFSVSDGTTGYTPFSIVGTDILFNGKVSFTNVTGVPAYAQTYYQIAEPIGTLTDGSIWYDTDDNNRTYRFNGTIWQETTINISGLGYTKNTTFKQVTAPTIMTVGDVWIDSDDNNKTYWYDGTVWAVVDADVALAINSNTTTVNGAKITTGSITASQIAASTITASQIAAGTITATQIATDTITASQIATGTITASEIATGTITADKMNVTSLSSISANIGTITAGSITADTITTGTISIARLPQQVYFTSDTVNTRTSVAVSNGGSSVMFGAYSGTYSPPPNFYAGKPVKVKFSFDLKVVTSSSPTNAQGMYVGSSAAGTTQTPGFFIGTTASTTYHTISNEIIWTPSSDTDTKCSVYLYNDTGVTTTITVTSGTCTWEQSWV